MDIDRVNVPGHQTTSGIYNLRPATTYHMRVVAENSIGTSEPSDIVNIITAEEGKYKGIEQFQIFEFKILNLLINLYINFNF